MSKHATRKTSNARKKAENLDSFHFLLKQAENPDLLADDPTIEPPIRQETMTGEDYSRVFMR
ncbi:hypothetical protein IEQ34_000049 [Dendrobium chrysotoxum]|uniref:Uncharacterized protein n=1 Tax=Dendrobium chrysotoxum TaxID=161865 RepID=A0AAV7HMF7_DENCH|nr:hypothetical protein IEQ34_000049 [Dendrobium chrysotoxum]